MNENIADRISFLVNTCGDGKNTVFALKINENEANIRNYRSGKTTPKYTTLVNIVNTFGVSTQWIMTGKGQPFKRSSPFADANPSPFAANGGMPPLRNMDDEERERMHEKLRQFKIKMEQWNARRDNPDQPDMPDDEPPLDSIMRIRFLEETLDRKEAQIADLNREIGRLRHILSTHNIDPNTQD